MGLPARADVPGPELSVVSLTDDVFVGTFGNVLFCHFRNETPLGAVEACRAAMRSLASHHPRSVFFGVIEVESTPPDDLTRRAFTRFFEEEQHRLAAVVITAHGEGFRGAMVRTIISGILSLAPSFRLAFPRHVVPSLETAADWTLRYATALSRDALLGAFRELAAKRPPPARR